MHWGGRGGVTLWVTRQGTVEAQTSMGLDTYLLVQHLYGRLALEDSLCTTAWILIVATPFMDEAIHNLGTFVFITAKLFSMGGRHMAEVVELFHLIEIMEKLHKEVQRMITFPHLIKVLLFDISRC